ncbi:MAG TPA: mechanosensitive ion channel domain-containing protein [Pyrinomonadaceae bacterium]|nr:mechanosensitive ion channel domain-containing protein [Pyrinomonadaceae bacterium]
MFKRRSIEYGWSRNLFALILIFTVGVQLADSQSRKRTKAEPTPEPTPQASPVPSNNPLIIATPQVATEAMQLNQRLRSMRERVISNESLTGLEQQTNKLKDSTSEKARKTETAIQSGATFTELQQTSLDWDALKGQVKDLSQTLTGHATSVENELKSLKSDESRWLATNEFVKTQESPPELLELTGKVVADISAALKSTEDRRSRIVALQQSVATQSSIVATEIEDLKKAMQESQRSLLEPDSLPLWKVQFNSQPDGGLARLMQGTYPEDITRLKSFIRANRTALLVIAFLTVVTLVLFLRLTREWGASTTQEPNLDLILKRPFSLALLVFLVAMIPLLYDAPNSAVGLLNLIGIIPVLRLLKPRLKKSLQKMLVFLIVSVLLWNLIKALQFSVWLKRDLLAVFTLFVGAVFVWLVREANRDSSKQSGGPTLTLVATISGITLLLFACLANIFGYLGLADLLTQGTLASSYRAVALYTVVVIGASLISLVFQPRTQQRVALVRTDRDRLARRLTFALGTIALLIWVHSTLSLFAVREYFSSTIKSALDYQIKIGSAGFTLGNIVAFVLTLVIGYLVASVIRAILGEEILPRLKLAYGLPNAIATVTHYVLLFLIFLLALAAAGVELSKFTVLTGAVGVGLGFGLQNVVNNFVSGLILLFERPIRVGDLLEVKGVGGEVTKIGVRSSTVHAFDGSDLIIPNATLISEQVTNWTLTGTRRQVFLNIHVAYGNDPTKVRDLLRATVSAHPEVLDFPAPTALFLGFGDSALNFEVRFWAARPEVVPELRSDVALSIAKALNDSGIKVPIIKRDLHISTANVSAMEAAAAPKDGG